MAENVHNNIDFFLGDESYRCKQVVRDPIDRCPVPVGKLSQALMGVSGQRRHPFSRPARRSQPYSGFGSGAG